MKSEKSVSGNSEDMLKTNGEWRGHTDDISESSQKVQKHTACFHTLGVGGCALRRLESPGRQRWGMWRVGVASCPVLLRCGSVYRDLM